MIMADRRRKDVDWAVANEAGELWSNVRHGCMLAVLMDIRDELKRISAVLNCSNCLDIPRKLERIARNTSKPKRRCKPREVQGSPR